MRGLVDPIVKLEDSEYTSDSVAVEYTGGRYSLSDEHGGISLSGKVVLKSRLSEKDSLGCNQ